jgi:prevent-host-death family protein
MIEVDVHEAKTHLSRLLALVEGGEQVLILRAGKPVARLVPASRAKARHWLGADQGKGWIAEDFDAPLPKAARARFLR